MTQPILEAITVAPSAETGRPIICVHGFWANANCWAPMQQRLAEHGHRSTAISLRGHGTSEGQLRRSSIGDYASDLAHVLDAHVGASPIVIAHSAGANVVQRLLETRSIAATVWFAPEPVIGLLPVALRVLRHYPVAVAHAFGTWRLGPIVGTPQRLNHLCFSNQLTALELETQRSNFGDESLRAFLDLLALRRPRPKKQSKCPTLIVGASEDQLLSQQDLLRTVAKHPGATLQTIEGASHAFIADRNAVACADLVAQWAVENCLSGQLR
jgi:pimeloyl-ACP methyl ester carboxylesterase